MAESLQHQVDKMELSSSDKKEEHPSVCVAGLSGLLSQVPCPKKSPVCVIVLGMAGSGKTSLVQRLTSDLNTLNKPPYVINLDPACLDVPYPANIGMYGGKQHCMFY
jgi:signal recognition particle GTPase